MWTLETVVIVGLTFLAAGLVKGVVGLGLPTVAIAVLTATIGLKPALALLLVPAFATNLWQSLVGGGLGEILRRTGTLLLGVVAGTWVGVRVLAGSDETLLAALLGVILALYAVVKLLDVHIRHRPESEPWLSPAIGTVNGVLTGMTGSYAIPALFYLEAMGFPRDRFVQVMGVLFLTSTVALAAALGGQSLLSVETGVMSFAAVAPSLIGMVLGARIRHRLSETTFRKTFFVALLVLGMVIVWRSLA